MRKASTLTASAALLCFRLIPIAAGALALSLCACTRHVDTEEPMPGPSGQPPTVDRDSTILVAGDVSVADLQAFANAKVPGEMEYWVSGHRMKANRGPIQIAPTPPSAVINADVSTHNDGGGIGVSASGHATVYTQPALAPDLSVHLNVHGDFKASSCHVAFLPCGSFSEGLARDLINNRGGEIDAALNHSIDLYGKAADLWAKGYGSVLADAQTHTTVLYHPTGLIVANPTVGADGKIQLGLGLTGRLQAVSGADASAVTAQPMPPATIAPAPSSTFDLVLPVIVDPHALASALTPILAANPVKPGGTDFTISGIDAAVVDQRMRLRVRGKYEKWFRPIDATLYIDADPYLDATTKSIRFRNVSFTAGTKNALLDMAAELVSPAIISSVESKAVVPLEPLQQQASTKANAWLANLATHWNGILGASVSGIELTDLKLGSGYIVVAIEARGTTSSNLSKLIKDSISH